MHNLPPEPTSFIGRADEIAEIEQLLLDPECRLLTLVGPGGIGKTRLAIKAAANIADDFADGVYLVPLQPLNSPDNITSTIASTMNIQFSPGRDTRQQLLDYIGNKQLLLVLDNFEHLLAGAGLVDDMLMTAPDLRILATSREPLNLQQEWIRSIQGMPFPVNGGMIAAGDYSSIQLFAERARRMRGDFVLADESADVVRICQLVEGVPLAIELAATFMRVLPCADIAREIQRNVAFLKTNLRNVEPRHQSMAAVFQWSWELLSAEEREVFKRLSVFRGGFWREAAEQVAGASLDVLVALVDKSLLRRDDAGRYSIHALLSQFAEEQLATMSEDRDETHDIHCEYYAAFVGHRAADIRAFRQQDVLQEIDNIRAAWRWAVISQNIEAVRRLLSSLTWIYERQNWYQEARDSLQFAINVLEKANPDGEKGIAYGMLLVHLGFLSSRDGRHEAGNEQRMLEGLSILRRLEAWEELAEGNLSLDGGVLDIAESAFVSGGYETLQQLFHESLDIFTELNMPWGMAFSLNTLGNLALKNDKFEEAKEYYNQGLAIDRKLNDQRSMGWALLGIGTACVRLGEYEAAKPLLRETIELANIVGYHPQVYLARSVLATIDQETGNLPATRQQLYELLKKWRLAGSFIELVGPLLDMSQLLEREGDIERAIELLALCQRETASYPIPSLKARIERHLEALEGQVEPEAFSAAQKRGKTLDLDETVAALLEESARGLDGDEQIPARVRVANGTLPDPLTERELEILQFIAEGLSNREIAERLVIAPSTVKRHISNCYGKIGVNSRARAILQAQKLNLV